MTETELRSALQSYVFDPTYPDGWTRNIYGNTEKIKDILTAEYRKNITEETKEKFLVVEVELEKEWSSIKSVKERVFAVWKKIFTKLNEVRPEVIHHPKLETAKVERLNRKIKDNIDSFMQSMPDATVIDDADITRNGILKQYKNLGVRLVLLIYNFDAVGEVFPKEEEAGGFFFQDMFDITPKASEENKHKIILVSEQAAGGYAHHMSGGSSFVAGYPEILLEETK